MEKIVIAPGEVEQAIFTWSKHNLGSGRGQGIGEVSAGLRKHVGWLGSLDLNFLRPFSAGFGGAGDAYEGWERLVALGSLPAGNLNVVFRTIASAGLDGAGRNRFLVHLMVGRAEEFDLGSIALDDPHWLKAEDCPLDQLPRLKVLKTADLSLRRVDHNCGEVDREARELLERLIREPDGIDHQATSAASMTRALLTALPVALWGRLRLGWSVGREALVANIGLIDEIENGGDRRGKATEAGLGGCDFHRRIEEIWTELPSHERSWSAFARAFERVHDLGTTPSAASGKVQKAVPFNRAAEPGEEALATIASALGESRWDENRVLDDAEAIHVVPRLEALTPPPGGWFSFFTAGELQALFSGVESNVGFSLTLRFFEKTGIATEALVRCWRETSLAALGFGAVSRLRAEEADTFWLVPRKIDDDELAKLMRHLRRVEEGSECLRLLLHTGFAANGEGRRALVASLLEADASPREIFGSLIPRAELPPRLEADFMQENVDLVIEWLNVPARSAEAFRLGFEPRKWFSLSSIFRPTRILEH